MALDIQNFRAVTGANRVLVDQQDGGSITAKGSKLGGKLVTWVKDLMGGRDRIAENLQARNAFYGALVKAEGREVADRAMSSTLGRDWQTDFTSLSGKNIRQVLDKASHIRMDTMAGNKAAAQDFANGLAFQNEFNDMWFGGRHTDIDIRGTPFAEIVAQLREEHDYPAGPGHDMKLYEAFMQDLSRHPDFPREPMTEDQLGAIAEKSIAKYYQRVQDNFDKEYSGLAQFAESQDMGFRSPSLVTRIAEQVRIDAIHFEEGDIKDGVLDAFQHIQDAKALLGNLSFDHERAAGQLDQIGDLAEAVQRTREQLDSMLTSMELGQTELDEVSAQLADALVDELEQLNDHLESKRTMLNELRQAHPFSEKNVSYTRLMLAATGEEMVTRQISGMVEDLQNRIAEAPEGSEQRQQLEAELQELGDKTARIYQSLSEHVSQAREAYTGADPDQVIPRDEVARSPLFQSEKNELAYVQQLLEGEGISVAGAKRAFTDARDFVLNTRQDWSTIDRTIVTREERTTRTAHSLIDSAFNLDGSYTQFQLRQAGLRGVSSHTSTAAAPEIPKNLQHSQLVVDGTARVDMIRHGILANPEQAKSVVSTAIWSDPVLREVVMGRLEGGDDTPIDYAFSNVNLESPWSRKIPVMGKRQVMQDAHIAAFKALADAPQPVEIPFIGPDGEETSIRVNLKVSVLAIPVNNAVGWMGHLGGVWSHVEQTNLEGLQSLLGDLGNPSLGVEGSARGTRIGGMIGEIVEKLDSRIEELNGLEDPSEVERKQLAELETLRANVQESVDIVRDIYCSGKFKEDDGNRYKFALAVMFATNLGKQAHSLLQLSRDGSGFGSSQGCMSNKDRGGNADALLKSLNLSAESAFKLLRFGTKLSEKEMVSMLDTLPPEDAKNMLITGLVYSGQLEAQQLQTLVMGSKNAGDLMEAIKSDPEAYPLLKGLSAYAKA